MNAGYPRLSRQKLAILTHYRNYPQCSSGKWYYPTKTFRYSFLGLAESKSQRAPDRRDFYYTSITVEFRGGNRVAEDSKSHWDPMWSNSNWPGDNAVVTMRANSAYIRLFIPRHWLQVEADSKSVVRITRLEKSGKVGFFVLLSCVCRKRPRGSFLCSSLSFAPPALVSAIEPRWLKMLTFRSPPYRKFKQRMISKINPINIRPKLTIIKQRPIKIAGPPLIGTANSGASFFRTVIIPIIPIIKKRVWNTIRFISEEDGIGE